MLVSNVDDHLCNHGFLWLDGDGWTLSPDYDLNPTPTDMKPRIVTTTSASTRVHAPSISSKAPWDISAWTRGRSRDPPGGGRRRRQMARCGRSLGSAPVGDREDGRCLRARRPGASQGHVKAWRPGCDLAFPHAIRHPKIQPKFRFHRTANHLTLYEPGGGSPAARGRG